MKYLSLFSGIGGFELGIQQAYALSKIKRKQQRRNKKDKPVNGEQFLEPECIGYSEIDKYAIQIYQKHFLNHKNYGDITKINEKELPEFDLLVGGFPCQAFSIAGNRGGFNDTRGTLFFEIARIVRQKQPRLLFLENVKGLLSHDKGRTFYTIISTLDELGYDCQWQVLNSKNHGVPQNRERVFIVGHLRGTTRPKVFPILETSGKDIKQLNTPKHSNDRIYGSEGVSPTLNTAQGGRRQPFINQLEVQWKKRSSIGGLKNTSNKMENIQKSGQYKKSSNYHPHHQHLRDSKDINETYQDAPVVDDQSPKIRRLTPLECERLQGFPDGWTEGVSDTQRYKTLGNAVTVNVVKDIIYQMI